MVGNDQFVLAQKFIDADQLDLNRVQIGFFLQLARHALLRRLAALHEAGHQREFLFRPRGIARQQDAAFIFDHRRQHRQRIIPMRPVPIRTSQPQLARFAHIGAQTKRRGAERAVAVSRWMKSHSHESNNETDGVKSQLNTCGSLSRSLAESAIPYSPEMMAYITSTRSEKKFKSPSAVRNRRGSHKACAISIRSNGSRCRSGNCDTMAACLARIGNS